MKVKRLCLILAVTVGTALAGCAGRRKYKKHKE